MISIDYNYYKTEYGGYLISESFSKTARFKLLNRKVVNTLSNYTFGRVDSLDDTSDLVPSIKDCMCEMLDVLYMEDEKASKPGQTKISETVGDWSVTYEKSSGKKSLETRLTEVIESYLGRTNLCCRWL